MNLLLRTRTRLSRTSGTLAHISPTGSLRLLKPGSDLKTLLRYIDFKGNQPKIDQHLERHRHYISTQNVPEPSRIKKMKIRKSDIHSILDEFCLNLNESTAKNLLFNRQNDSLKMVRLLRPEVVSSIYLTKMGSSELFPKSKL